jgi:ribosomal-protein-alanine N-acetyltransferase
MLKPETGWRPEVAVAATPGAAGHLRVPPHAAEASVEAGRRDDDAPATPAVAVVGSAGWRAGLPELTGTRLTLRDLRLEDARSLFTALTTEEVARFISPPPTSVEGFERFIAWAHERRAAGRYACFAVVPAGTDTAVGLFQVQLPEAGAATAEWGFALGSAHWGTGLFRDGARLLMDFAFEAMGIERLEARACVANGRGNGALRKVGAVREAVLQQSFERHGQLWDQALWTILREDWLFRRGRASTVVQ